MLTKKAPPKKLATLSEKEIQERLYGFYHKSDMVGEPRPKDPSRSLNTPPQPAAAFEQVQPASSVYVPPVVPVAPSGSRELFSSSEIQQTGAREMKSKFQQAPLSSKLQPITTPKEPGVQQIILEKAKVFFEALAVLLKKVPLQYYVIAGSAIVLVFVFFQLVTLGFKKMNAARPHSQSSRSQEAAPVTMKRTLVKPAADKTARSTGSVPAPKQAAEILPPEPSEPPALPIVKSYAVQLCLSDNLDASQVLIDTLKTKGYEAYFRKVKGSRGNELFQIFVGRYPSSAEAQSALKELRKDAEFKNYDDSFVRTI